MSLSRVVVAVVVKCIEVPLQVALAVAEGFRESSVVHRLSNVLVDCLSSVVSRVLQTESVQVAVANCIAQGMNTFLQQPNLDDHIRCMAATMSRTQPDLARQQGQDFPVIVGSFLKGMIHGVGGGGSKKSPITVESTLLIAVSENEKVPDTTKTVLESTPQRRHSDYLLGEQPSPAPKASLLSSFPKFGGGGGNDHDKSKHAEMVRTPPPAQNADRTASSDDENDSVLRFHNNDNNSPLATGIPLIEAFFPDTAAITNVDRNNSNTVGCSWTTDATKKVV